MAGVSGTPYSMEGGHSSSSFSAATDDVDRDMTGGFFSSDQTRLEELKKMLDGNKDGQKLESMKRIIGMIAKGRNVSALFPAVVKNVVSKNPEIKKLVYVYLMRYAEEEQDLALLSISTFQKALKDPNQLIRASALRVLSSIRVPVIVPIMMLALKECVTDMSAFVRKTVAHAIPKLFSYDSEQKDALIELIERLLTDRTTLVAGSAVTAFEEVCGERIDLIHKNYRKLCNLLVDVDEWGQLAIIQMLTRYARTQFLNPNVEDQEVTEAKFYSSTESDSDSDDEDDDEKEKKRKRKEEKEKKKKSMYVMDSDHRLLLQSTKPLLQSRNAAVVLAVAQLYFHTAPAAEHSVVIRPLVRLLRSHSEVQWVVLTNIATVTSVKQGLFEPYLKSFFVMGSDPTHVKLLKLEIMTNLANETNISVVLREFQTYVTSNDKEFVAATIRAIGRCASNLSDVTDSCLTGLMGLVSHRDETVVGESVVIIKTLLQMQPSEHKDLIVQMAKLTDKVQVPMAKASILWLMGEYSDRVPKIAPDVLRKMVKSFPSEEDIVKLQILNLASKLCLTNPKQTKLLCHHVLNLAKYDTNYDIRDRARFLRTLLFPAEKSVISKYAKKILLVRKPAPVLESAYKERNQWQFGTLSHLINSSATGYQPLPDFPLEQPDPSVRNVEVELPWKSEKKTKGKGKGKKPGKGKSFLESFYSESTEESGSESESSSGSGSEESDESGSGSDESGSEATESEEESGSWATESEPEEEEEEDEEEEDDDDDEETDDEEDFDDDESEDEPVKKEPVKEKKPKPSEVAKPTKKSPAKKKADTVQLLDFGGGDDDAGGGAAPAPIEASAMLKPSIASDLDTLETPSKVIQLSTPSSVPRQSFQLLHRITGKSLAVSYSFTRKEHLYSDKMVDVELVFTNQGDHAIQNIAIGNKQLEAKMELHDFGQIDSLAAGESISVSIGVNFADTLNPAKFDLVTKSSKFPVKIEARVGELIRGIVMSEAMFAKERGKLAGMNETSGQIALNGAIEPSSLVERVLLVANMSVVSSQSEEGKVTVRFCGQTSCDRVAVLTSVAVDENGKAKIVINCEKIVIGSMLLKEIKAELAKA